MLGTGQRVLIMLGSAVILALYIYYRWRRASRYVESRNTLYSEHYRKLREYAARVRKDGRWPQFFSMLKEKYKVIDSEETTDEETYSVHYCCIWDDTGRQYEPDEDKAGISSITAYLKRGSKPRYLSVTLSSSGEISEEKVSGGSWYDMFEKSV